MKNGKAVIGRERKLLANGAGERRGSLADYTPAGGDPTVEAFRSLGADLSFLGQGSPSGEARLIVFTSPWRGEGKTFSAVNFAATRALQGIRTLLIDADLRAGSASSTLGLGRGPGLTDVLSGQARLLDVVRMVKVGDHRLAVAPAGALQADVGKLLLAEGLTEVLATATEHFEQVVIDTPPLNIVSDAALFAARADVVLVVVRAGHTDREALDTTLGRLARVGARTVGIVLNDVKSAATYGVYPYGALETEAAS
ncbi:MAG: CpsD/CapB family tyrosine-protein kinase [Gemmatimonadetes bacterium]|nr:CpsD/CapB family tyrosine-protein kinase [Gemmatimonadota bacterium]